jgi:hypothetical protein
MFRPRSTGEILIWLSGMVTLLEDNSSEQHAWAICKRSLGVLDIVWVHKDLALIRWYVV